MKRIKFRAWHKREQEYELLNSLFEFQKMNLLGYEFNEYIFEQYTGLKDKNDKEIYEGDIYYSDYHEAYYKIVFSEEYCGYFCVTENQDVWHEDWEVPLHDQMIEIIGNIHKNPELLEN